MADYSQYTDSKSVIKTEPQDDVMVREASA